MQRGGGRPASRGRRPGGSARVVVAKLNLIGFERQKGRGGDVSWRGRGVAREQDRGRRGEEGGGRMGERGAEGERGRPARCRRGGGRMEVAGGFVLNSDAAASRGPKGVARGRRVLRES